MKSNQLLSVLMVLVSRSKSTSLWTGLLLCFLMGLCEKAALGQERRFNPDDFYNGLDSNKDGLLQSEEIPDRLLPMIERRAEAAGLDPGKPIPIEKLQQARIPGRGGRGGFRRGGGPTRSREGSGREGSGREGSGREGSGREERFGFEGERGEGPLLEEEVQPEGGAEKTPPSRPRGFGGPPGSSTSRAAGFGNRPADVQASEPDAASEEGGEGPGEENEFVKNLLKRYDDNENGVLEKDEWLLMKGNPARADQNKDSLVTLEELGEWLGTGAESRPRRRPRGDQEAQQEEVSYSRPESRRSYSEAGTGRNASSSHSASGGTAKKSYRFLTPEQRFPSGLPGWFPPLDRNGDGQVSMAEYTSQWTDAKAAEFARHDRNGDGFITPRECLDARS